MSALRRASATATGRALSSSARIVVAEGDAIDGIGPGRDRLVEQAADAWDVAKRHSDVVAHAIAGDRRRGLLAWRGLREHRRNRDFGGLDVGGSDALRPDERTERISRFRVRGHGFAGGLLRVRHARAT